MRVVAVDCNYIAVVEVVVVADSMDLVVVGYKCIEQ